MNIGMKVQHVDYGVGTVKGLTEHLAEIRFEEGVKTLAPENAEMTMVGERAEIEGLNVPLDQFIGQVIDATVSKLKLKEEPIALEMAAKWKDGNMILKPANPELQSKEVPLELFFHKIVMMRNNLRVLEQKFNSHKGLTDTEKFDLHQYITRSYGSMTTFNLLFKDREDYFSGSAS